MLPALREVALSNSYDTHACCLGSWTNRRGAWVSSRSDISVFFERDLSDDVFARCRKHGLSRGLDQELATSDKVAMLTRCRCCVCGPNTRARSKTRNSEQRTIQAAQRHAAEQLPATRGKSGLRGRVSKFQGPNTRARSKTRNSEQRTIQAAQRHAAEQLPATRGKSGLRGRVSKFQGLTQKPLQFFKIPIALHSFSGGDA